MTADPALDPIDTDRLRLRRSVPEDAEEISAYRSDPKVNRYQGGPDGPDGVRAEVRGDAARAPGEPGWVQYSVLEREARAARRRRRLAGRG